MAMAIAEARANAPEDREAMEVFMNPDDKGDAAFQRFQALATSPELNTYPNHMHLIAADNPRYDQMATAALLEGNPVLLVYEDGCELLICPEPTGGARLETRRPSDQPIAA